MTTYMYGRTVVSLTTSELAHGNSWSVGMVSLAIPFFSLTKKNIVIVLLSPTKTLKEWVTIDEIKSSIPPCNNFWKLTHPTGQIWKCI